jgi:predicted metal-dependent hydrolase
VHFLEIYHNDNFYEIMEEFMTDYKERTRLLNKEYGQIGKAE